MLDDRGAERSGLGAEVRPVSTNIVSMYVQVIHKANSPLLPLSQFMDHQEYQGPGASAASHSASVAVCGSRSLSRRCHTFAATSSSSVGDAGAGADSIIKISMQTISIPVV